MPFHLREVTRGNTPIIIPLKEPEVVVGLNNIELIKYAQLSKSHAKFYVIENNCYVRDLESEHGIFVNDSKIQCGRILPVNHLDIIGFGVNSKSIVKGFVCMLVHEYVDITLPPKIPSSEEIDVTYDSQIDKNTLIDSFKTEANSSYDLRCLDVKDEALQAFKEINQPVIFAVKQETADVIEDENIIEIDLLSDGNNSSCNLKFSSSQNEFSYENERKAETLCVEEFKRKDESSFSSKRRVVSVVHALSSVSNEQVYEDTFPAIKPCSIRLIRCDSVLLSNITNANFLDNVDSSTSYQTMLNYKQSKPKSVTGVESQISKKLLRKKTPKKTKKKRRKSISSGKEISFSKEVKGDAIQKYACESKFEDDETLDSSYSSIIKDIFENYEDPHQLPSNQNVRNSDYPIQEVETVERIEKYLNFSSQEAEFEETMETTEISSRSICNIFPPEQFSETGKTQQVKRNQAVENISSIGNIERKHSEGATSNRSLQMYNLAERTSLDDNLANISDSYAGGLQTVYVLRNKNELVFELNFDALLKTLLKFKPIWLQEQIKIKIPPAEVMQGVNILPLSFSSHDSYATSFYPLLKVEIWQALFQASTERVLKCNTSKTFHFTIISIEHNSNCLEIKCDTITRDTSCFEPYEGMMTVLNIQDEYEQIHPLFGYVLMKKTSSLNLNLLRPCWSKNTDKYCKNSKYCIFHVWIKEKKLIIQQNLLMEGHGLCYIRNKLRIVDALRQFKDSPLMTYILTPKLEAFTMTSSRVLTESSINLRFSSKQLQVIETISCELQKSHQECKIMMVDGPPGTGKTHIIIGLLEKLFLSNDFKSNMRVLVTTPSNTAIDEIGCRLIELNNQYGERGREINFTRVGVKNQMDVKLLPYSIEEKVAKLHDNTLGKITYKMKDYHHFTENKPKMDILKQCDVILSTIGSCSQTLFTRTFQHASFTSDIQFACCIVDEATQATELESLQALKFYMNKLILVGDHNQLPASHPECLRKYKFDRSMFERFEENFKIKQQVSPIICLSQQFRMHPSICQFPMKYMYNTRAYCNPEVEARLNECPLIPYAMLDGGYWNETLKNSDELIYEVLKFIVKTVDSSFSIGVIVAHEIQRYHYTKFFQSQLEYKQVEVNTLNAFQGKEKDIVILNASNPKAHASDNFFTCKRKFNVSLTRARKSLIICLRKDTSFEKEYWNDLRTDAKARNLYFPITSSKDIFCVLKNDKST